MCPTQFSVTPQTSDDQVAVEALLDQCFGLARRTKTTYRLREGEQPVPGLCFVARTSAGRLVGAISFWGLRLGEPGTPALLLGPLAVAPDMQGIGIGRALMSTGLQAARERHHKLVILVGDEPYYARLGFRQVPPGRLLLPGPVDPARLLYLELESGAVEAARGVVLPPGRFNALRGTTLRQADPAGAQG